MDRDLLINTITSLAPCADTFRVVLGAADDDPELQQVKKAALEIIAEQFVFQSCSSDLKNDSEMYQLIRKTRALHLDRMKVCEIQQSIGSVADRIPQSMKLGSNSVWLLNSSRRILHQGHVQKQNRRGKLQPCHFVLFNDCLLYLRKSKLAALSSKPNLSLKRIFLLEDGLQVSLFDDGSTDFAFVMKTPQRSFIVKTDTYEELIGWMDAIEAACNVSDDVMIAPLWSENGDRCQDCNSLLSMVLGRRKHHCRACGGLFCGKCSEHRRVMCSIDPIHPVRVCDGCELKFIAGNFIFEEKEDERMSLSGSLTPSDMKCEEIDFHDELVVFMEEYAVPLKYSVLYSHDISRENALNIVAMINIMGLMLKYHEAMNCEAEESLKCKRRNSTLLTLFQCYWYYFHEYCEQSLPFPQFIIKYLESAHKVRVDRLLQAPFRMIGAYSKRASLDGKINAKSFVSNINAIIRRSKPNSNDRSRKSSINEVGGPLYF